MPFLLKWRFAKESSKATSLKTWERAIPRPHTEHQTPMYQTLCVWCIRVWPWHRIDSWGLLGLVWEFPWWCQAAEIDGCDYAWRWLVLLSRWSSCAYVNIGLVAVCLFFYSLLKLALSIPCLTRETVGWPWHKEINEIEMRIFSRTWSMWQIA